MTTIREYLRNAGALDGIALPEAVDVLLGGLQIIGDPNTVEATSGAVSVPLFPGMSLDLPAGTNHSFLMSVSQGNGFRLWLQLGANTRFDLDGGVPGLVPAKVEESGSSVTLKVDEMGDALAIVPGADGLALLVEGRAPVAILRLVPALGELDGLVKLCLSPAAALIGDTGFGIEAPEGIVIDQSPTKALAWSGNGTAPASADPAWQGLVIPDLLFHLPADMPVFGGFRVGGRLEIGQSPATGIALTIIAQAKPHGDLPPLDVRIECMDPAASGLGALAPTLVEVAMKLPEQLNIDGSVLKVGDPLVVRARYIRDPTAPASETLLTVVIEGQGSGGLASIEASKADTTARSFVAAGAFATAIIATKNVAKDPDGSGVAILGLLAEVGNLADVFLEKTAKHRLILNSAELLAEGRGSALDGKLRFRIDYSVDVVVRELGAGIKISMNPEQPMRVRMREVVLGFDLSAPGTDMFSLDFSHADMEVEDPGGWKVEGLGSLFDIVGTRSGRGSMWLEVDLAFRLDLGPVKVSGATLRATLLENKDVPEVSLRGFDAALKLPPLVEAGGGFQIRESGFGASLDADLIPLQASGLATLFVDSSAQGGRQVLLNLDIDLPGPLPLGPTGLGLFGAGGTLGIFTRPKGIDSVPGKDPVQQLLAWVPNSDGFEYAAGNISIGLRVAIGTAPDMGFMFGAVGGLVVTAPDIALRGSLAGKLMGGRPRLVPNNESITDEKHFGPSFTGAFLIDPGRGTTFGLHGVYSVGPLFRAEIPVGGNFPVKTTKNWYINIGADGKPYTDRSCGPAMMTVLPNTVFEKSVRGYLMLRGNGLQGFPFNTRHNHGLDYSGFVVAFGFSFDWSIGLKPVLWADVHGGMDVLVASMPLVVAGRGWLGGSLHIGPVSIGVESELSFTMAPSKPPYFHARVCGKIDLWLTSIRECIEFGIGEKPGLELPPPDVHPLDKLEGDELVGHGALLVDDQYRRIAELGTSKDVKAQVWADAIILLQFATAPGAGTVHAPQFVGLEREDQAQPLGTDRLRYWWTLDSVRLFHVSDDGSEKAVDGPIQAGWQVGRFGDTTQEHEVSELALLTRETKLFTQRMPDGGRSLPHDPIGTQGRICQLRTQAKSGWALGRPARWERSAWHLPPDLISPDQARSKVEAKVGKTCFETVAARDVQGVPLHPFGMNLVPAGIDLYPAHTEMFSEPSQTTPPFDGAFWLDGGSRPPMGKEPGPIEMGPAVYTTVHMNDEIHDGEIWLVSDLNGERARSRLGVEFLTLEREWENVSTTKDADVFLPDVGSTGVRTAMLFKVSKPFSTFRIRHALDFRVGILGIGGITRRVLEWVRARNDGLHTEKLLLEKMASQALVLDEVAGEAPVLGEVANVLSKHHYALNGLHTILEPGELYRLEVCMSWSADLQLPGDPETSFSHVSQEINAKQYTPRHGENAGIPTTTDRSYFFRILPRAEAAPVGIGSFDSRWRIGPATVSFHPELLERHLLGYTPSQAEQNWFRCDPLEAHFGVRHVAALAHAYGYDLKIGLQRVDVPGEPGKQRVLGGMLGALSQPHLLPTAADRYIHEIAESSPCVLPRPGVSLSPAQKLELAPRAWYEVHVALPALSQSGVSAGRLPGITFRTSRYCDVAEMASAIGFGFSQPGTHDGDVALALATGSAVFPTAVIVDDDLAFEGAMAALGMEGWPVATEPRTSLLWRKGIDGKWLLGGVLIEGAEPVHRPRRCEVQGLRLVRVLAGATTATVFDVIRRDRSGSRLLYLASTPFPLSGPSQLELAMHDFRHQPAVTKTGRLTLPTGPGFEGEKA